jgi:TPR repeat protein
MDAAIDLRSASDRLMDSQVVRLEWIKKRPAPPAAVGPALDAKAPSAAIQPLEPAELATLLRRGQDFLKTGDIASARLVLQRAANAGNAPAALALGASFDPFFLADLGVLGFAPDPKQARVWYRRAAELGSAEAARRLEQLSSTEK